jgi:hypothetical protein
MLDGKIEGMNTSYLEKGTMIHMSILQKDEFAKTYRVRQINKPKSKQQKDFADNLVQSTEIIHDKALLDAYRKVYADKKASENTILLRAKELEASLKDYIADSKDNSKTNISFADKSLLDKIHANIADHKLASYLLDDKNFEECHNEFHINWEYPVHSEEMELPCKSLIDRCVFNWEKKEIILMDLKTTSSINDFSHSINTYDYCRQLAFYWMAIFWYIKNVRELNINVDEWTFKTYIIAMSTGNDGTVRVFDLSESQLNDRIPTINFAVEQLSWHHKNNKWEHTKEYYNGDGSETVET